MDPGTSQSVILNRPDGKTRWFNRLSPSDRIAFRAAFRLHRKLALFTNLQVAGIGGEDALRHLNAYDARRLYEYDVEQWVNELEGQQQAITLSLRKSNGKQEGETDEAHAARITAMADGLDLDDDERLTVAAGVMGMVVRAREKENPENPPNAASETVATGGETHP